MFCYIILIYLHELDVRYKYVHELNVCYKYVHELNGLEWSLFTVLTFLELFKIKWFSRSSSYRRIFLKPLKVKGGGLHADKQTPISE